MKNGLIYFFLLYTFFCTAQNIYQDSEYYYDRNTFLIDDFEFLSATEFKDLKRLLEEHYRKTGNPIWIRIKHPVMSNDSMRTEAEYMFSKLHDSTAHNYQTLILITSSNNYTIKHNWQSLANTLQNDNGGEAYHYAKEKGVSDLITYRLKVKILLHYIYHRGEIYKGLVETIKFIRLVHKQEAFSSDIGIKPDMSQAYFMYGVLVFSAVLMVIAILASIFLIIRNIIRFTRGKY